MSTTTPAVEPQLLRNAVELHGDLCPGLAMGVQAARLALEELGAHTPANYLVAVAENDTCGVDGIQALTGCTVGNRNLVRVDWGKNAYSFFRRSDGKAIRISGRPAWDPEFQQLRMRVMAGRASDEERAELAALTAREAERILATEPRELFDVTAIGGEPPATPRIDPWLTCDACGESVMETRTRRLRGKQLCIPCFEAGAA
jgi:formylmethanofuran dehydrogenase subunit E